MRWVQSQLADFKEIKNALGGTVNDAVLAVVAGALRRWLSDRGVRTEGTELRALVPGHPELAPFVDFLAASERSIIR